MRPAARGTQAVRARRCARRPSKITWVAYVGLLMSAPFLKGNGLVMTVLLLAALGGGVASWRWHGVAEGHRAEAERLRDKLVFMEARAKAAEAQLSSVMAERDRLAKSLAYSLDLPGKTK